MTRATVVVPCFNAGHTIADQLDALVPQAAQRSVEIVIVDNNSTDDSIDVVATYADRSPNLRVVHASDGQSVAYARNVGAAAARGEAILFCDADDIVSPDWVATMLAALDHSDVVTGRLETEALNTAAIARSRGGEGGGDASHATFYQLFDVVHGGNMALTREAWERIGPFDESLRSGEDMEWSFRVAQSGCTLGHADDAVIHYRYRATPRDLWRQGKHYGNDRPEVARRVHAETGVRPSRFAGARSWAWLVLNAPRLVNIEGRAQWAWVAGSRVGNVQGSFRSRFLVL